MDTSETYIKMCEKAIDIQDGWNMSKGDTFVHYLEGDISDKDLNPLYEYYFYNSFGVKGINYGGCLVWLPRQDQLQGLMGESSSLDLMDNFYYLFICLSGINGFDFREYCKQFSSMEQLWLAFIMQEKYGKTWNKEDWI